MTTKKNAAASRFANIVDEPEGRYPSQQLAPTGAEAALSSPVAPRAKKAAPTAETKRGRAYTERTNQYGTRLTDAELQTLRELHDETGKAQTFLIGEALALLFKKYGK